MGTGLSTILVGTALQLSGATENAEKCVAIGRMSESTALWAMCVCVCVCVRVCVCALSPLHVYCFV